MSYARPYPTRRRPFLSGLGATVPPNGDVTYLATPDLDPNTIKNYARAMQESAMKVAVAQTAAQVGIDAVMSVLLVSGPIGWAIDAVLALVQIFSARYDKKKIKEIGDALRNNIQATANDWSARYDVVVADIYAQEQSAALSEIAADKDKAATGNKAVAGLGGSSGLGRSFWESAGNALAKGFAQTAVAVPRATGIIVLKALQTGATVVGDKRAASALNSGEKQWINLAARGTVALTHDITHGSDAISHFGAAARMVYGEQAIFDARKRAGMIQDEFAAKIKAQYDVQVAQIRSPLFRTNLRAAIKSLLLANDALAQSLQQSKTRNMLLAAAGAAVAGYFAFLK